MKRLLFDDLFILLRGEKQVKDKLQTHFYFFLASYSPEFFTPYNMNETYPVSVWF
jgi:hypothetical protein